MAPAAKPLKFNTTKPSTSSKGKTTTSTTANVKVEQKEEKVLSLETAQFKRAYREAAKEMGPPTHKMEPVDVILRSFDTTSDWGPVLGLTRLERWERSLRLGLNPPLAVKEILMTPEGLSIPRYRDPCFSGL